MEEKTNREWRIYGKKADFAAVAKKFDMDIVAARVLRNRDLITEEQIRAYLNPSLDQLYDPMLLPDMAKAVEIISEKIRSRSKVRIVGDYDVDGVCASYILYDVLAGLGADCSWVIPERIRDGYGISHRIVEEAIRDGIQTIVTCDNGISAFEEIQKAVEAGITVIITDHHEIRRDAGEEDILPAASCIVNAERKDSRYPEKEICGCVTAWKFAQAILNAFGKPKDSYLRYLEFAALATICDCMVLKGENRIIAKAGLKALSAGGVNRGMRALIRQTGLSGKNVTCFHAGFVIGPCINAGGRMETAKCAFSLFASQSEEEADEKARYLKELNDSRKDLTLSGTELAAKAAEEKPSGTKILVIRCDGLLESLAGIVAGRIKEKFGKPTLVFTPSEDEKLLKGSGRSIEKYDLFAGLSECSELIEKFGGHPMAAGLTVTAENLPKLEEKLNRMTELREEDLKVRVWIDSVLPLSYVSEKLVGDLEKMEPFGNGNARPVFAERNVHPASFRVMGKNRNVLKMTLLSQDGTVMPAIMFGEADRLKKELENRNTVNILYYPVINEWNGYRSLNIQVEEYQ